MREDPWDDPGDGSAVRDLLVAAAADAEHWLARWMHEGATAEHPLDVREFNAAVTALRRLIDARKALKELHQDDKTTDDGGRMDPEDFRRLVYRAMGQDDPDGGPGDDSQTLPD